jgi:hypothetical protein
LVLRTDDDTEVVASARSVLVLESCYFGAVRLFPGLVVYCTVSKLHTHDLTRIGVPRPSFANTLKDEYDRPWAPAVTVTVSAERGPKHVSALPTPP